ncbi:MAG: SpoIID/LytB domain-containing protein [Lachnospiraceae bacterium]|nr:SpoIID/LytB domain-containing protein [Lachnospiraceae bacterium]
MKSRIYSLLMSIFVLLVIIIFVILGKKQPVGEYITKDEMLVLTDLVDTVLNDNTVSDMQISEDVLLQREAIAELTELVSTWEVEEYITYGKFLQWEEIASENWNVLNEEDRKELSKKYRKALFITKQDWFSYFEKICEVIDPDGKITTEELLVLGDATNVVDIEGNPIEETKVLTQNGKWEKKLGNAFIPMQQKALYITYQGALWGVYNVEEAATLVNAWIVENTEEEFVYFYKNYKVTTIKDENLENLDREQVADIQFVLGGLQNLVLKTDKITGKVLKVSSEEVEIQGMGTYPISENIQYYRLYDRLENVGRSEVRLGYDFTDFVVEEGQIQAALLVKDEKMENIRVLIKNSNFDGYFHEKIEGRANVDMELVYGQESYEIAAGESFSIEPDSDYFVTNRIYLKPKALTGRTIFSNIERNNGGQGYYGTFELEKREEGILLINEVLLEEYLYAVVPSEMPGYYPLEALKAQAISARTYAYNKMIHAGLSSYGANLDDSATYQVYNNIKENANTTTAVKETRGELLYADNHLAGTYYYSTSCGFGTDAAIWNADNVNAMPYLQAKEMTTETGSYSSEELQIEENFADFIKKVDTSHFEAEENWYRWTYEHENIEKISEKLVSRLENYPNYVFTSTDGECWGHDPLEEGFAITDIQVKYRGAGGTIEELLICTNRGYFLVKNEYHVRAVITDGEAKANLQNDKTYACGNLLPSAFFIINTIKDGEMVIGIKLTGGGFGHGVGMSQNGAKNLANLGYDAKDILEFYYKGSEVRE